MLDIVKFISIQWKSLTSMPDLKGCCFWYLSIFHALNMLQIKKATGMFCFVFSSYKFYRDISVLFHYVILSVMLYNFCKKYEIKKRCGVQKMSITQLHQLQWSIDKMHSNAHRNPAYNCNSKYGAHVGH